jgi:hypothetical protein
MFTLIFVTIAIALATADPAATSPVPNATTTGHGFEPPFKPNPKGRGTMSLLMSCTMMLAVWTVIHPNIIETPTMLRSLRNKGLSVLTALLAPELVLAQAYSEWRQARKLVRSVRHVIIKESMQAAINESDVLIIRAKASLLERDDEQKALKDAETALNKAREALATIESDQSLPDSDLSAIEKANQLLSEMLQRLEIIQDSSPFWRTGFCFPLMLAYLRLHFWFKRNFAQDTRKRPIEFTMADAFFTLMGGYTFSLAGYPRGQNRTLVVEAEGLLHLLRSGALSAYSLSTLRDDVSDRSKADAVAQSWQKHGLRHGSAN